MKKVTLVFLFALALTGLVMAQNYVPTYDVLGAHQNNGRGCAGCHAPHSGARGSGHATSDPTSGNAALWGQDVSVLYGKTISSGPGYVTTFSKSTSWSDPEGSGLMMCLSCHDGNYTPTNMMTNQSYEQKLGILPKTYGSNPIPTLLGNDGTTAGNYLNDHPVGRNATIDPNDWVGTGVTFTIGPGRGGQGYAVKVAVAPGSQYDNFLAVYGDPALTSYKTDGKGIFPVCTTCHNQHSMSVYSSANRGVPIAGNKTGTYQTFFFVKGPYNPAANTLGTKTAGFAASTTQFCRQCHFGDSNESNGAVRGSIPTAF